MHSSCSVGFSNQRYTSACICVVNICRTSNTLCRTFNFFLSYYFCLSPLVPCQNMQYTNNAEGQVQGWCRLPFEKSVLFYQAHRAGLFKPFYGIYHRFRLCCKCLNVSEPSVSKIYLPWWESMMLSHSQYVEVNWIRFSTRLEIFAWGWDACDTFLMKSPVSTHHCGFSREKNKYSTHLRTNLNNMIKSLIRIKSIHSELCIISMIESSTK